MKYSLTAVLLLPCLLLQAQDSKLKPAKDSASFYRSELNKLRKDSYDSLVNSEKYIELTKKLETYNKEADKFGVELLGYAGGQINSYPNINQRLRSLNVTEIKTLMGSAGFGLALRFSKLIIGYDMSIVMAGGSQKNTSANGFYIHGYFSTNAIKSKKWIFSPQIGVGTQSITAKVVTVSSANNFDAYFSSANQVEIRNANTVLDFAMAFKMLNANTGRYMPILRTGYRLGLSDKIWEIKNGISTGGTV